MRSKISGILAALFLIGATGAAAAQSAAPLSLANLPAAARAGGGVAGAGELRGGRWVIAAVVLGLLVWGAIELFDDGEEDFPVSP